MDRLQEIEKKSWENERLLLKIALAYAEIDRLSSHKSGLLRTSKIEFAAIDNGGLIVLKDGDMFDSTEPKN